MRLQQSSSRRPAWPVAFVVLAMLLVAGQAPAQEPGIRVLVGHCLPPDTAGLHAAASGPRQGCHNYHWSLNGGTITAGQGTATITFTSGPPDTRMTFMVSAFGAVCGGSTSGYAEAETSPPVAAASGGTTICPGLATRLNGSGGSSCEWAPADGLDDPHSCTPIARPSDTTTYSLVVASSLGCRSTNEATVTVAAPPGPQRVLTVDHCPPPGTPGVVASMSGDTGESYFWGVSGGAITGGQSTDAITLTAGPAGQSMSVSVAVTGGVCSGFVADTMQVDYGDAPPDDIFHSAICTIGRLGISVGCGNGDFCRDASLRRDQMAVLLLKARHGGSYQPPSCTGIFDDVACPGPFTDWVEQLEAEGITAGCGAVEYCPARAVTRAEMAVFLLKAEHGAAYAPQRCTGAFADVPCAGPFTDWIEALHAEGITGGCGTSPLVYCPGASVTRGQTAALVAKTFRLQ